jgi:C1A family cysteine protease
MEHKLNFTSSPKDSRDYIISTVLSTSTGSCDLSSGCTSVKNQGSIGSCTAHASIALLECNLKRFASDTRNDVFSELFTYYVTRVNVAKGSAIEDKGAYLRDTLTSLVRYGSCLEGSCPYLIQDYSNVPSTGAYQEALNYQVLTYLSIPVGTTLVERQTCLTTLKGILQNGYPFVGGFTCYSNLYSGQSGNVPLPVSNSTIIGGHAVCFVGYDDTKQVFKFKNSWGSSWGDNGYGYLPYQYLLSGNVADLWTIYTQENGAVSIDVVKPKTASEILQQALTDGLVAISQNLRPIVPTAGITNKTRVSLQGFFNRIITMKSQVK